VRLAGTGGSVELQTAGANCKAPSFLNGRPLIALRDLLLMLISTVNRYCSAFPPSGGFKKFSDASCTLCLNKKGPRHYRL